MTEQLKFAALHLDARDIPVPTSISPEARGFLSRAAESPPLSRDYPAIDDVEGWQRWVATAEASMAELQAGAADLLAMANVETLTIGEAPCYRATSKAADAKADNVILSIHGGAFIAGGGEGCRFGAQAAAVQMGATIYAPDYRMPPRNPYPVPLDDCLAAYREVIGRHGPERVVVHGMSAGGNLAAALMLRVVAERLPLPAGLVLETPELDLTESGDSFETNRTIDVVLQGRLTIMNRLYAGGHDLKDPYLSPLFGDFSRGYPPTLITAGTRDLFLSNAARMLHKLRKANVPVTLLVYEAMPHGGFFGAPEDMVLKQDIRRFAEHCWNAA
jgi:monoterpene epsilon-lactone hydrolase